MVVSQFMNSRKETDLFKKLCTQDVTEFSVFHKEEMAKHFKMSWQHQVDHEIVYHTSEDERTDISLDEAVILYLL